MAASTIGIPQAILKSKLCAAAAAAFIGIGFVDAAGAFEGKRPANKELLSSVAKWSIQLQGLDLDRAARDPADLLVIDYSRDGTEQEALAPDEVQSLQTKPDGSRRLVLSYLSIGEAESYRYYWQQDWTLDQRAEAAPGLSLPAKPALNAAYTGTPPQVAPADSAARPARQSASAPLNPNRAPHWLHTENAGWKGNYHVRFWEPEWQSIIFGTPDSYLDRIIDAGFDGVSLDRADIFNFWEGERETAAAEMADFIARLSAYAKERNPDFLVIVHNAEELAGQPSVEQSIDGFLKEDLLYGVTGNDEPNTTEEILGSVRRLQQAQASGLPIFVIEYISDQPKIQNAKQVLDELGFVAAFGQRDLGAPAE